MARMQRGVAGYPPLLRVLGLGTFINSIGMSFIWPLTTVYIHDRLGRSLTVAGIVLLFNQAAAAMGSLTGGILFDRIGPRRVMLWGLLASAAAIALPGLFTNWPLYVAAMVFFGFSVALVRPATFTLAAKVWPGQGRRPFNFLYVLNNMGVAVGTALGGLLVSYSFRLAFLSTAALSVVFAGFVFAYIQNGVVPRHPSGRVVAAARQADGAIPWAPIIALFAGFLLLHAVYGQWQSTLPVFMGSLGIGLPRYSLLWTLNGLLIVLGQPLLTLLLRRLHSLPAQLLFGTCLYIASFSLVLGFHGYAAFVGGMLVLTLGEMILWPGVPAAVAQLSPPGRAGFLQGFIDNAMMLGRMTAPILGGLLYDHSGIGVALSVMVALLVVPLVCFGVYARLRP